MAPIPAAASAKGAEKRSLSQGSAPEPKKALKPNDMQKDVVPINAINASSAAVITATPSHPQHPEFLREKAEKVPWENPAEDMKNVVIPWVQFCLLELIRKGELEKSLPGNMLVESLDQLPNLQVVQVEHADAGAMKTFKVPWDDAVAANSLKTTGMFEACDRLFKIDASPPQSEPWRSIAALDGVTWAGMLDLAKRFSQVEPCKVDYSTNVVLRTIFPTTLRIPLENLDGLRGSRLLLMDHVFVWAWYWSMFEALAKAAPAGERPAHVTPEIERLLQCALTTTQHARVGLSHAELAIWANQGSEGRNAKKDHVDTFVSFAAKARIILPRDRFGDSQAKKVAFFQALDLTYKGGSVNKIMVAVIDMLHDSTKVDGRCRRYLLRLVAKHGADVLSSSYSKLSKIILLCVKEAEGNADASPADILAFALSWLSALLDAGGVKPKSISQDWFDKPDDTGVGPLKKCFAVREILSCLIPGWLEDLPTNDETMRSLRDECKAVIQKFDIYETVMQEFSPVSLADSQGAPIDKYIESLQTKAARQLALVLYDLFAGTLDGPIAKSLQDEANVGKKIKEIDWLHKDSTLTSLKELDRLLNAHKNIIRLAQFVNTHI